VGTEGVAHDSEVPLIVLNELPRLPDERRSLSWLYKVVHDLHTGAGLIDAYDVAVIERREGGKAKAVKKHETPTRVAGSSATG
jgi:hypothetical protein